MSFGLRKRLRMWRANALEKLRYPSIWKRQIDPLAPPLIHESQYYQEIVFSKPETRTLPPVSIQIDSTPISLIDFSFQENPVEKINFSSPDAVVEQVTVAIAEPDVDPVEISVVSDEIDVCSTLFEPIRAPIILRKTARGLEKEKEELLPFAASSLERQCRHGVRKEWCSYCEEEHTPSAPSSKRPFIPDILESIWPILLPPPGRNFDNAIFLPPTLKLRDFQIKGTWFLIENERALLADEMGLGKSIQAIVALKMLFRKDKTSHALIVCPKIVITDWKKKLWDWAPELTVLAVSGLQENRKIIWEGRPHIFLVSYETLRKDIDLLDLRKYDLIILDEAQKTKNPEAMVSRAIRKLDAPKRWALTGTPLENSPDDVIAIFDYLVPNLFRMNFQYSPKQIKEAIKPYMLRRLKKDVLKELPEKVRSIKWLELTQAQREKYDQMEARGRKELEKHGSKMTEIHVLALITKLKLLCNYEPESGESVKLEYLEGELETIKESGDKALVFSQYPHVTIEPIKNSKRLDRFKPLCLHGQMSTSQRDDNIKRFQEDDTYTIMLAGVKVATGIDLIRANHVFHFDMWWNPSVAEQAEDRGHRIGQKKTVYVHYLYTVDTVEERIFKIIERKRELFASVIDACADRDVKDRLTLEELLEIVGVPPGKTQKKPAFVAKTGEAIEQKASSISLTSLTPREFEIKISQLFEKLGYKARVTQYSRDGGIDIEAKYVSDMGEDTVIIQCKHYPEKVVGVDPVRSLYGVLSAKQQYSKAYLVTSGYFSQEALKFAEGKRLFLWDRNYLESLMQRYELQ